MRERDIQREKATDLEVFRALTSKSEQHEKAYMREE